MKTDTGTLTDLRWRLGCWVLCVLLVVGGACAVWAVQEMQERADAATYKDSHAIGESVAQTLAEQLARAVRVGIPLAQLPGVPDYLAQTVQRQPMLNAITLLQPDGSVLHTVGQPAHGDVVPVPITVQSRTGGAQPAGFVVVEVGHAASARQGPAWSSGASALAVIGFALLGALTAAFGPGAHLEAKRRAALAALHQTAHDAAPASPEDMPDNDLQRLLDALALGDGRQHAQHQAVQDYADELLNTDFDGSLRPRVERILGSTRPR